ncbi:hypothetical protein C5167_023527 [Papaver somniferum]|uniref:Ubiquitin-like domain-containing protein n=1 Tax=Papaver somniferum TaxID=3469 RepID=A0A4Y7JPR9_PAPSO|nr:small ubiquitin-related modifier 2-like [Papaver somniferum]XP_026382549.1 small ubiquitin-related modifier 2-like [Papaver somniferum]RZC61798.1 hypothetical protein C5167_023527 [Papaver somniferum]
MSDTNDGHEDQYGYPVAAQAGYVNVKLKYMLDGSELYFKIKRDVKLSRVMSAYCKRKDLDFRYIKFLFDEKQINLNQTPDKLEMEEGDIIDVVQNQNGGGYGITAKCEEDAKKNNIKNGGEDI